MKSDHAHHIFDQDVGKPGTRKQFEMYKKPVSSEELDEDHPAYDLSFLNDVHEEIVANTPHMSNSSAYFPSVLYSPGEDDYIQPPHYDLPRADFGSDSYLLLVALMDNTKILVLHRSHQESLSVGEPESVIPIIVTLEKGDCILFHPFLVHCGYAYDSENIRLHYYVIPQGAVLDDFTEYPSVAVMTRCNNPTTQNLVKRLEAKIPKRERKARAAANRRAAMLRTNEQRSIRRRLNDVEEPDLEEEDNTPVEQPANLRPLTPREKRYLLSCFDRYMKGDDTHLVLHPEPIGTSSPAKPLAHLSPP